MKRDGTYMMLLLAALATGSAQAARPDPAASPYTGIVERNVFDIHPAPPADPAANRPPAPPAPAIRLNGITDILHKKQVLLKVQLPAKPPTPAKEEAMVLTEGQRQGEIEILEIDVKAGTVKINDYGTITNLSLEANSEKLTSGPPAGAPPGGAPPPALPGMGSPIPAPNAMPQLPAMPGGKFPPRTLRLPGSSNAQGDQGFPGGAAYAGTTANTQQVTPSDPTMTYHLTPEEAEIAIEAQRLKWQQEGNPQAGALPPTSISRQAATHLNNPTSP